MEDRQQPIVALVEGLDQDELRDLEDQRCRDAAEFLQALAGTLPTSSEIRALMLRSASRWAVAGGLESAPHLRRVRAAQLTG